MVNSDSIRMETEAGAFEDKQKLLFDCLDNAEKELKGTTLDQTRGQVNKNTTSQRSSSGSSAGCISKFQGRQSIFKKPALPIYKCLKPRTQPDYQINPHKWKRYSLSDVDISDRTNTTAAFAFLREMEIRKDNETNMESQTDTKVTFNRKVVLKKIAGPEEADSEEDKPKLRGSKVVMPEYVIGQASASGSRSTRRAAKKKVRADAKTKSVVEDSEGKQKQLMLSHLMEGDEDDE